MDTRDPLGALPTLLKVSSARANGSPPTDELTTLAPTLRAALATPGALESLPSLVNCRVDQIPIGSLVRFRGMIQDVRDPEYYAGVYEERLPSGEKTLKTGKYRDVLEISSGGAVSDVNGATWQRLPLVCVTVPSETQWVQEKEPCKPPLHGVPCEGEVPQRTGIGKKEKSGARPAAAAAAAAEDPMEEDESARKRTRGAGTDAMSDETSPPVVVTNKTHPAAAPPSSCLVNVRVLTPPLPHLYPISTPHLPPSTPVYFNLPHPTPSHLHLH